MAWLMCFAYRLRACVILSLAAACLCLASCCCCCCCCCCLCCCLFARFSSNTWRLAGLFGGLCPPHVPMTPGGARDLKLGFTDTCPTFWTSLTPGLLRSLDCTPGRWTPMTPGLPSSLDWTPGLLISMPAGLTPSRLRALGRESFDADSCISEQAARFLMGVFLMGLLLSEPLDGGCQKAGQRNNIARTSSLRCNESTMQADGGAAE